MKVLIVSLALFIVNLGFISFQGDMGRYLLLQNGMKAAAEECAAGAGLYYNEAAYGRGEMVIDRNNAEAYAEAMTFKIPADIGAPEGSTVSWSMEIVDDASGIPAGDAGPSVTVTLRLDTEDLFRLWFLKVSTITRSARYELAEY